MINFPLNEKYIKSITQRVSIINNETIEELKINKLLKYNPINIIKRKVVQNHKLVLGAFA
jgi:hypothetical protein